LDFQIFIFLNNEILGKRMMEQVNGDTGMPLGNWLSCGGFLGMRGEEGNDYNFHEKFFRGEKS
jgi:hypothetical protein